MRSWRLLLPVRNPVPRVEPLSPPFYKEHISMKLKIVILFFCVCLLTVGACFGNEREGVVSIKIRLNAPADAKTARIWLPYPVSERHQTIEDMQIEGNFLNSALYREPESGALYLFAEWKEVSASPSLDLTFKVSSRERRVADLKETGQFVPAEARKYLDKSWWIPADGELQKIAREIQQGKRGILEKARSVYDWVVENTTRDPNVKGCGLGVVEVTLAKRSGKCADLSSVYVALARSIGVPAREVFGLRLGRTAEEDITGGHHCWAEFYLPGSGWVPVDPSDVRKVMLRNRLELSEAESYREYYFGGVDEYRIVLGRGGRGIKLLPPQQSGALNYFMYPYAEIDGKSLDHLEPDSFRYSINFVAL